MLLILGKSGGTFKGGGVRPAPNTLQSMNGFYR